MRRIIISFFVILLIDFFMIILFIALHMTDEPLPMVVNLQFGILKYICGFPLVIINTEYPFFLSLNSAALFLARYFYILK